MRLKHVDKVVRCVSCVFPALGMSTGAHRGSTWCPGETSEPGEKAPLSSEHRWAPTVAALLHTLSAAMTHCIQTCPYISSGALTRVGSLVSGPFYSLKSKDFKASREFIWCVWFRTGAWCSFAGKKKLSTPPLCLFFVQLSHRQICGSQWN